MATFTNELYLGKNDNKVISTPWEGNLEVIGLNSEEVAGVLADNIVHWDGPVVAVIRDQDFYKANEKVQEVTQEQRKELAKTNGGGVFTFSPGKPSGKIDEELVWSIAEGCEDPITAYQRARTFVEASEPYARPRTRTLDPIEKELEKQEKPVWENRMSETMSTLLQLSASERVPFSDVLKMYQRRDFISLDKNSYSLKSAFISTLERSWGTNVKEISLLISSTLPNSVADAKPGLFGADFYDKLMETKSTVYINPVSTGGQMGPIIAAFTDSLLNKEMKKEVPMIDGSYKANSLFIFEEAGETNPSQALPNQAYRAYKSGVSIIATDSGLGNFSRAWPGSSGKVFREGLRNTLYLNGIDLAKHQEINFFPSDSEAGNWLKTGHVPKGMAAGMVLSSKGGFEYLKVKLPKLVDIARDKARELF
jgi:hypothetical protein